MDVLKMPSFRRTFSAESNSKELKIPRWFSKYIKIKTPSKVHLKGPIGGTWAAELVREDGRLCFKQGWKEFQRCHSLRDKDLLVFEYDDKESFNTMMYQEKFGQDIEDERLQMNLEDTQNAAQPQPQPAVAHETIVNRATDSVDEDSLCFVQTMKRYNVSQSLMAVPTWFVNKHFSGYGEKIEVVLENTTRKKQWPVTLFFKSKTMFVGWSRFARENEIKEGDTCKFVLVRKLTMLVHISPKKASPQELKREANPGKPQLHTATDKKRRVLKQADDNEAREHKLPENVAGDFPSFTITMKPYNVRRPCIIHLSTKFVATHCYNYGQKATITLVNEQGKEWSANMFRNHANRGRLSGGWPLFVGDNQIKENDTCTFILVEERKMLVQIARHCKTSKVEEDPRVKVEHPTCNTDRKTRSDGVNKRKRGSEEEDLAVQVAAATADIAELREVNRKILQLLQERTNSGAK